MPRIPFKSKSWDCHLKELPFIPFLNSPLEKIFKNEIVSGAIKSLVGSKTVVDHQFLHLTFPSKYYAKANQRQMSQVNHQDSTIDPRTTFDIQLFYFPTAVTKEMGGTRYI